MTQDLEAVLRKSLDEADRGVKVLSTIFILMTVLVAAGLLYLAHLPKTADVKTMLLFSVVIIVINQAVSATVSCVFMTAMTRKTLKAIELSSRE
jgi:hypothetical protein